MAHHHTWLATLMDGLDASVDAQTRAQILEACGRACARTHGVERARELVEGAADIDGILARLNHRRIGGGRLQREGDTITGIYEKCYCPLLKGSTGEVSPSFCECSRGWLKELFEAVLGRPAAVEFEQTVQRGDPLCRFVIRLGAGS